MNPIKCIKAWENRISIVPNEFSRLLLKLLQFIFHRSQIEQKNKQKFIQAVRH